MPAPQPSIRSMRILKKNDDPPIHKNYGKFFSPWCTTFLHGSPARLLTWTVSKCYIPLELISYIMIPWFVSYWPLLACTYLFIYLFFSNYAPPTDFIRIRVTWRGISCDAEWLKISHHLPVPHRILLEAAWTIVLHCWLPACRLWPYSWIG